MSDKKVNMGSTNSGKASYVRQTSKAKEINILGTAAFCLSLVSWLATAQGLTEFVFKEQTLNFPYTQWDVSGILPFMISFGIQAILLTLSLNLPKYLHDLGKRQVKVKDAGGKPTESPGEDNQDGGQYRFILCSESIILCIAGLYYGYRFIKPIVLSFLSSEKIATVENVSNIEGMIVSFCLGVLGLVLFFLRGKIRNWIDSMVNQQRAKTVMVVLMLTACTWMVILLLAEMVTPRTFIFTLLVLVTVWVVFWLFRYRKVIVLLTFALCLSLSSFFSFIAFSNIVYMRNRYNLSDYTLRKEYGTILSESEEYAKEAQKWLLRHIQSYAGELIKKNPISKNMDELKLSDDLIEYFDINLDSTLQAGAQSVYSSAYVDSTWKDYQTQAQNILKNYNDLVNALGNVSDKQSFDSWKDNFNNQFIPSIEITRRSKSGIDMAVNPDGANALNPLFNASVDIVCGAIINKSLDVNIFLDEFENNIKSSGSAQNILTELLNLKAGDDATSVEAEVRTLIQGLLNGNDEKYDLNALEKLKMLIDDYILLQNIIGNNKQAGSIQLGVFLQIHYGSGIFDTNKHTNQIVYWENEYKKIGAPKTKKNNKGEYVLENEAWQSGWHSALIGLEGIIRSMPLIDVNILGQPYSSGKVDIEESSSYETTTVASTTPATVTTPAGTPASSSVAPAATPMPTDPSEESGAASSDNSFTGVNTTTIKDFASKKQDYANRLIELDRVHLSEVNPIERYWTILIYGPYRGMAWFALVIALFLDLSSLAAGINIFNLQEQQREEIKKRIRAEKQLQAQAGDNQPEQKVKSGLSRLDMWYGK